jgi:hypothetical protein
MTRLFVAPRPSLASSPSATARYAGNAAIVIAVTLGAALMGYVALHDRRLAIGVAVAALLVGMMAGNAARLAVLATVGVWLIRRVPGNISVTDVLVALAGLAALAAGVGRTLDAHARLVLRAFAFYLATLLLTLAFNQNLRADFEWFHRIALVAGAILVGAWLVRSDLHHRALQLLLAVTVGFSLLAVLNTASRGFAPAQPLGYQKNFIGSLTATVLLVLVAAHREFELPRRVLVFAGLVVASGLVASQSRGAMVAATAGLLIWFFRASSKSTRGLRRLAFVVAVCLGVFAAVSIRNELNQGTYSSFTQRTQVEQATRQLWKAHPLTGVGLRFFKTARYAGYQPPNNVVDEVLAEAGVFGLLGFVTFVVGSLWGLGRLNGPLATAALCVVAARFIHGLFDIYWTGGTTTLPWIIAGMALASASPLVLTAAPGDEPKA